MRVLLALAIILGCVTGAAAQTLQPGDQLEISVWQDSKLDRRVIISQDGMIAFPLVGHVRAAGLTPQAVENTLRSKLQRNYTDPLNITVALVSSQDDFAPKIYVTGEVTKPGPYLIKVKTNIMQAISLAGGLSPFAAKKRIQVRRRIDGVETIFVFDYTAFEAGVDVIGTADLGNIDLRAGDVIIVPERALFE